MSKAVPEQFPDLDVDRIRAALPVRGSGQWREMAQAANHLIGRGATLAMGGPETAVAGGSAGGQIKIRPTAQHLSRLWVVTLAPLIDGAVNVGEWATADAFGAFSFTYDDGSDTGSQTADWRLSGRYPQEFYIQHDRDAGDAAPSSAEHVIWAVTNDANSGTSVVVQSAICVEVPKYYLAAADDGMDDDTLVSPHPITNTGDSIDDAYQGPAEADSDAYRKHLFSWSHGNTGVTTTTSAGAWVNLMQVDPYVLGRLLTDGETTRTVKVNAIVNISSAATAELRITASSGDSYTYAAVTAKATVWLGWQDLDIDCDEMANMAADGGLRGNARDSLAIEARITVGSGPLTTFGIIVAEAGT